MGWVRRRSLVREWSGGNFPGRQTVALETQLITVSIFYERTKNVLRLLLTEMCPRAPLAQHVHEGFAQGLGIVQGVAAYRFGQYETLSDLRG